MAALFPRFAIGLLNAWVPCVPVLLAGIFVMGVRRDVARRMADRTGYTRREKLFTIAASLMPYPYMALTVWTPFTTRPGLLAAGLSLYLLGLVGYVAAVITFMRGTPTGLLEGGVYRLSRNPLYVSAAFMFIGIGIATANVALLGIEIVALVLQHFMIVAEERACRARFGQVYAKYAKKVPRYLASI